MVDLPDAILFACTHNAIRSPMAAALCHYLLGHKVYIDSAGTDPLPTDGFMISVMDEMGIDLTRHSPKSFEQLEDGSFDVIVTLSASAHHHALEMTRSMACEVEYWATFDPSSVDGPRDIRLDAYRQVRDQLFMAIKKRFGITGGPVI